jgi:hypothetical protein
MLARMDYLAVEGAHLLERCREVGHSEIGKREAISWARAALVDADCHPRVHRLPTLTLVRAPRLERRPKQLLPEASRPIRIVGRKLDQEWQRCHDSDATENGRGSFGAQRDKSAQRQIPTIRRLWTGRGLLAA